MSEIESMGWPVHPAANLFPLMDEGELSELSDDIKNNGQVDPVVLLDGRILDGRNRAIVCKRLGVKPKALIVETDSPVQFVIAKNLHRRHLSTSQKAAVSAEMLPMLAEEAKKRQGNRNDLHRKAVESKESTTSVLNNTEVDRARGAAAKAMGVGSDTVARALRVKRKAPELFEKVKSGELTVNAAVKQLPPAPQAKKKNTGGLEKVWAKGDVKKLEAGLSQIRGICLGLEQLELSRVVSACPSNDLAVWIETARELSAKLKSLANKLQKKGE